MNPQLRYIATGGNRHPSAADWTSGLLAYGAGNNIALWNPEDETLTGVYRLLRGHSDTVNAVRIVQSSTLGLCILSGSSDNSIRVWLNDFTEWKVLNDHTASVNTISTLVYGEVFASGAADGSVKLWKLSQNGVELLQSITLKPKFIPLATALIELSDEAVVLAVAGTTTSIQIYAGPVGTGLSLQATLSGHEGWIRSLDFRKHTDSILLASTSQDKYIRLWKLQEDSLSGEPKSTSVESLSNKLYRIRHADRTWVMSYDALLVGHEDWIYTARWSPSSTEATLLTASADNSLSIWRREEGSGLWICETRLGEISSLKGSTTATGSTGGFWIGLWSPNGSSVVSLSRTGSWRLWSSTDDVWQQRTGISGHVQEVQSVAWANDGSYLLSTSSDQTTRLWSEWRTKQTSWHEMARPQIHGYDLNCVTAITRNQFVSGADEKLLRVFNKPKAAERLLSTLAGRSTDDQNDLPDIANIPVLGLSNKAVAQNDDDDEPTPVQTLDKPPVEDTLARHTLWPEHEKLYGHGYEISAVAVDHASSVIATACKASTLDHAVIRLYETREWREIKPPLSAHTLTVTSLSFSRNDTYLLSVGRDRQWALFKKGESAYEVLTTNPKGHSRMILDCSWASDDVFATAGRDKVVRIWNAKGGSVDQLASLTAQAAVTAVAFSASGKQLMYGTEDGDLFIASSADGWRTTEASQLDRQLSPSAAITSIAWRPQGEELVAVSSEDTSVRLYGMRSPFR